LPTYTAHVFPQFAQGIGEKLMNLPADTLKVALSNAAGPITLATSGVQAAKLFTDWATNVAAEITGTGYTAGGLALAGVSWTTTADVTTLTCSNPQWTGATFTANQAVFYDSSASTIQLICFWDFGGSVSVTDGPFTLGINASGLYTHTAS
jgi:hypothetical protein